MGHELDHAEEDLIRIVSNYLCTCMRSLLQSNNNREEEGFLPLGVVCSIKKNNLFNELYLDYIFRCCRSRDTFNNSKERQEKNDFAMKKGKQKFSTNNFDKIRKKIFSKKNSLFLFDSFFLREWLNSINNFFHEKFCIDKKLEE